MKSVLVFLALVSVTGCDQMGPKYKCVDGDVYIEMNGAWVEAGYLSANKCLPDSEIK